MDTKDLIIFKTVYETRSINKATDIIFMSPQGISKVIKKLEGELGVTLFTRTYAGMIPTSSATTLYKSANQIINIFRTITFVNMGGEKKRFSVVCAYGLIAYLGFEYVEMLSEAFSDYDFQIHEETDEMAQSLLCSGRADLGLIGGPLNPAEFDTQFCMARRHVAVVNRAHPLAKKKQLSLNDLSGQTVVLIGRRFNPYYNNINRLARAEVQPEKLIEVNEMDLVHSLALKNSWVGLSVDFAAERYLYDDIVIIPFMENDCSWDTYFATTKGKFENEAVSQYIELTKKYRAFHHL